MTAQSGQAFRQALADSFRDQLFNTFLENFGPGVQSALLPASQRPRRNTRTNPLAVLNRVTFNGMEGGRHDLANYFFESPRTLVPQTTRNSPGASAANPVEIDLGPDQTSQDVATAQNPLNAETHDANDDSDVEFVGFGVHNESSSGTAADRIELSLDLNSSTQPHRRKRRRAH